MHQNEWKTLYRTGANTALLAIFVFRWILSAEFVAFNGQKQLKNHGTGYSITGL